MRKVELFELNDNRRRREAQMQFQPPCRSQMVEAMVGSNGCISLSHLIWYEFSERSVASFQHLGVHG